MERLSKGKLLYFYIILIVIFYGFGLTKHLAKHENKLTALFYFGSHFSFPEIVESEEFYVFQNSDGYDGQFYLLVALDPFFSRGFSNFIDKPDYRYTRILLPVLSHILAFGKPSLIPGAYIFINLFGLALGCWYFIRIIRFYGASDFYVLLYAISLGMYISIRRMLPDAFSINLMVVALYYHLVRADRKFLIFIMLSVLTRETIVLMPIAFFFSEVWREKKIRSGSLVYLIPVAVLLLWTAVIHLKIGMPSDTRSAGNFTAPFVGMLKRVWLLLKVFPRGWIELVNMLMVGSLIIHFLFSLKRRRDPLQVSFAAYAALASCLHDETVLIDIYAYGRIVQPLIVFSLIEFLRDHRSVMRVPAGLMSLEAFHMLFGGRFRP